MAGEHLDEKSRSERHRGAAHALPSVRAADIEKAIAAIEFPKTNRVYRDAAEVAIAYGEVKGHEPEPPSVRGGRAAATETVSAASVAKVLGGIEFPATKAELIAQARRNQARVHAPAAVLEVLERPPNRQYHGMRGDEIEVGTVL